MTFTDKITYLAFRADWKARYLDIIRRIRLAKVGVREAQRNYQPKRMFEVWDAYSALDSARKEASDALLELAGAKVEAGRQMAHKNLVSQT